MKRLSQRSASALPIITGYSASSVVKLTSSNDILSCITANTFTSEPIITEQRRSIMIRPEGTVDPTRFPLGYISLSGKETIETIYQMISDGHYVVADRKLQVAHDTLKGVSDLLEKEHPVATIDDAVYLQNKKRNFLSKILIKRDFWAYDDFNDPRVNQSFGLQNIYFDNYQWSQHLWPQFQAFAEKWFPTAEHTHLSYREYLSLIVYFAAAVKGMQMKPLLPPSHRIKPPFGVPFPSKANREPMALFATWLQYFRAPLMINKALVVRGGCGVLGMVAKLKGVPMVRVCDPSPLALEAGKSDADRFGWLYRKMSFMTAEMFPPLPSVQEVEALKNDLAIPANANGTSNFMAIKAQLKKHTDYNMVVYHADMPILRGLSDGDPDYHFAPGLQGYSKHLEQFFEEAGRYLSKNGIVVVVCTNLYNLAYPDKPNPIEFEIKTNRRWVILDYYDRPMKFGDATTGLDQWSAGDVVGLDKSLKALQCFKNKLRSEVWVLHKVESLEEFGWIHGVPGAKAPSHVAKFWKRKTLRQHRLIMMRQQVELSGQDWGQYKSRMLRILQENAGDGADRDEMEPGGEPEDDEAAQIRMAMDPTYPMVLARRARKAMVKRDQAASEFHGRVYEGFMGQQNDAEDVEDIQTRSSSNALDISPREDFDAWTADLVAKIHSKQKASNVGERPVNIIGGLSEDSIPALSESPYISATKYRANQSFNHSSQKPRTVEAQYGYRDDEEVPYGRSQQRSE